MHRSLHSRSRLDGSGQGPRETSEVGGSRRAAHAPQVEGQSNRVCYDEDAIMMLAQGLVEYGAVGGGGGAFSSLASALAAITGTVRNAEPRTWIIASVSAVLLWFLFVRTR